MQTVAATILVDCYIPVVVAVGVEVEQFGIAILFVVGGCPVELLRGVECVACPVDTHLVIRRVPSPCVSTEFEVGLYLMQFALRQFEDYHEVAQRL